MNPIAAPHRLFSVIRQALPQKGLTAAALLFLILWTACAPASRLPTPAEEGGERFGEIHWYAGDRLLQ